MFVVIVDSLNREYYEYTLDKDENWEYQCFRQRDRKLIASGNIGKSGSLSAVITRMPDAIKNLPDLEAVYEQMDNCGTGTDTPWDWQYQTLDGYNCLFLAGGSNIDDCYYIRIDDPPAHLFKATSIKQPQPNKRKLIRS